MAEEIKSTTTQGEAVDPASTLLAAFNERVQFCEALESVAAEETRWHDAAMLKTQRLVWRRAAMLVEELAAHFLAQATASGKLPL